MNDIPVRADPTLAEWLAVRAHTATVRRLALDLAGGTLAIVVGTLWRPRGWPAVVAAGACFVAYGAWAFAERRLTGGGEERFAREDGGRALTWRVLRSAAAVVGGAAALLLVFALLFGVLGTWIS